MQPLLRVLLLLATTAIAAQGADIPHHALLVGPVRPLQIGDASAIRDQRGSPAAALAANNNITISQSRVVLSHIDQLFLLSKLVDTIDLAPKLASSTSKMSSTSGISNTITNTNTNTNAANEAATTKTVPANEAAQGFLFVPNTTTHVSDADVALINVLGTTLGFGWRYPLAYWNQLAAADKPKCAFAKSAGAFFYC